MVSGIHGLRAAGSFTLDNARRRSERASRARSRLQGAAYLNISAADAAMECPSRNLMAEVFWDMLVDGGVTGTDTLISIDKVHRLLGYTPNFTLKELF